MRFGKIFTKDFHVKQKSIVERCAVPQGGQIKSKGNSVIKKKERYAVQEGGQINLYGNSFLQFARKKRKRKERKKERKEERKNERKKESKQERKKKERKDRLGSTPGHLQEEKKRIPRRSAL